MSRETTKTRKIQLKIKAHYKTERKNELTNGHAFKKKKENRHQENQNGLDEHRPKKL